MGFTTFWLRALSHRRRRSEATNLQPFTHRHPSDRTCTHGAIGGDTSIPRSWSSGAPYADRARAGGDASPSARHRLTSLSSRLSLHSLSHFSSSSSRSDGVVVVGGVVCFSGGCQWWRSCSNAATSSCRAFGPRWSAFRPNRTITRHTSTRRPTSRVARSIGRATADRSGTSAGSTNTDECRSDCTDQSCFGDHHASILLGRLSSSAALLFSLTGECRHSRSECGWCRELALEPRRALLLRAGVLGRGQPSSRPPTRTRSRNLFLQSPPTRTFRIRRCLAARSHTLGLPLALGWCVACALESEHAALRLLRFRRVTWCCFSRFEFRSHPCLRHCPHHCRRSSGRSLSGGTHGRQQRARRRTRSRRDTLLSASRQCRFVEWFEEDEAGEEGRSWLTRCDGYDEYDDNRHGVPSCELGSQGFSFRRTSSAIRGALRSGGLNDALAS